MEFIETPVLAEAVRELLSDEECTSLQLALALRPGLGDVFPGGRGLRKMRWRERGRGERGALRVIYYWERPETICMLYAYRKSRQADLTRDQVKAPARLVEEYLA
jgi:hypothetical protein